MPKEQRGRGEGGVFGARILFFAVFVDSGSSRKKGENQTAEAHLLFERLCGDYVDKTTSSSKRPRLRNSTSDGTSLQRPSHDATVPGAVPLK